MEPTVVGIVHDDDLIRHELSERIEGEEGLILAAVSADASDLTLPSERCVVVVGGAALGSEEAIRGISGSKVVITQGRILDARAAIRIGAADILQWPLESGRLPGALRGAAVAVSSEAASGRILAVAGARGGLGATTLAAWIASSAGASLLVQLDGSGSVSELADAQAAGLETALQGAGPEAIRAAAVTSRFGVPVLAGGRQAAAPSMSQVPSLMRALRPLGRVVVDAGRLDAVGAASLRAADERIVIVADEVGCARAAASLQLEPFRWIRRRFPRRTGFPSKDLDQLLGSPPVAILEDDARVARARDLGELSPVPAGLMEALSGAPPVARSRRSFPLWNLRPRFGAAR